MKNLTFLLVNDDGINAKGLKLAKEILQRFGQVFICAPDKEKSGSSHSISLRKEIKIKEIKNNIYTVNGTPVDCVIIAIEALMSKKPDMLVSGINYGFNLGEDTLYSGTLGAAREGYLYGVPSIAFSVGPLNTPCFDAGKYYLERIIKRIIEKKAYKKNFLLNINLLDLKKEEIKGIKITKLGKRHYINPIERINEYTFKIGGKLTLIPEKDTDVKAVLDKYVSITPLKLDTTDLSKFKKLKELFID